MTWLAALPSAWIVLETGLKLYAVGTVPENRRPASSSAWLLLILFLPLVGFPLYWLIGSPWVRGRRHEVQARTNQLLAEVNAPLPQLPDGVTVSDGLASVVTMNRRLTALPCVTGRDEGLYGDTDDYFAALAGAIGAAREHVHIEFYIVARDDATEPVFQAMFEAVRRGVQVRLLLDHLGSRKYPGRTQMQEALTAGGVQWHHMMPIDPLRGRWRRPDLRNHRKLMVVDGTVGFIGSHNLIGAAYGSAANEKIGRRWKDLSMRVTGDVVTSLQSVFLTDWFTETGELLDRTTYLIDQPDLLPGDRDNALQLVPSGPGFPTEPNLRMFTALVSQATEKISITSPYFVPDESLLAAITSAAYRGVRVELFVGEQADQFLVGHAQRSYYRALLTAGVVIHLYPTPTVLHGKYLTVDDAVGVIGSSNMDFRSFGLTYEIMLMGFGGSMVARLQANDDEYRAVCRELTLEEWDAQPWHARYIDNVCRLTAALM
ncbi:cardiolipin synthase [Ornithinimicrobium sp. F0845]|uniref:cardiolipin synthase n=1 Tax=Ornithinimicrobium sp. F0845 TaxID=2926412 RepID=UPI001FF29760|nr:cardiolipin synthase [Ornithinimicrobium sp. F0845]MCK0110768.1 cardiolipin synthase [Ornithinimicrobium sp. F0845]